MNKEDQLSANVMVLVGAQWGDEGKGKWVDILSKNSEIVARFQGGNNAGHTLYIEGEKIVLHQLPSGIFQEKRSAALLSGVVINPVQLAEEINKVSHKTTLNKDNLWISEKAHVITPYNIYKDTVKEENSQNPIGTTKRGIGPTYSDKIDRSGLRMLTYIDQKERKRWMEQMSVQCSDFRISLEKDYEAWRQFEEAAETLKDYVQETESKIRTKVWEQGSSLLLEGAQGSLLDISHGTYPFVTSSTTTSGGAVTSLGMDPRKIDRIYGVAKAYITRVGEGPFPTELVDDEVGRYLAKKGHEFGATTNRPRRCGWFDTVAMRYSASINGFDSIFLNKMDILSGLKELKVAVAYHHPTLGRLTEFPSSMKIIAECKPEYETLPGWDEEIPKQGKFEDLPQAAQNYVKYIEEVSRVKVSMIGSGPGREDFIANLNF